MLEASPKEFELPDVDGIVLTIVAPSRKWGINTPPPD
jgi:hypothetical protein